MPFSNFIKLSIYYIINFLTFRASAHARQFPLHRINIYLIISLEGLSLYWALRATTRGFESSVFLLGRVLSFDEDQVYEDILNRLSFP